MTTTAEDYIFYEDGATVYLVGYKGDLTQLTLPDDFKGKNYELYAGAFNYCTSITNVVISDGVTAIGSSAFEECSSLTSITIGNSVTEISTSVFDDCISLESITVDINNTAYSSQDGILYNKNKTDIIYVLLTIKGNLTLPDGLVSIGFRAFENCTSLTSVSIPDSVTSISSYAFSGCTSLESINIPDSVTSIGVSAFQKCRQLESVTFENVDGWWRSSSNSATSGSSISSTDLADSEKAASYLRSKYSNYFWKRTTVEN